ncbi:hypothetical protein [Hymenobacter sp.]|uniref:hypothetical protein n=1 Tax=Hymenobacter sp. TaxID=1898978 RepID=UPI00286A15D1|nr:hypothetical protein [Hymenobacter sp.]
MNLLRWSRQYGPFLFLGLVVIAWFYVSNLSDEMHERAKFTIGYLTGSVYQPKSGKYYRFRFEVQGTSFTGADLPDEGMDRRNGARVVVEYDSANPTQNTGYFNLPVPDSIRRPPANGWRVPPFPVPRQILDRGKKN